MDMAPTKMLLIPEHALVVKHDLQPWTFSLCHSSHDGNEIIFFFVFPLPL